MEKLMSYWELNCINVRENDPESDQIKSSNKGELKFTKVFEDLKEKKPVNR